MSALDPRRLRELNRWLAVATGLSLAILTWAVWLFGAPERRWAVVIAAPLVVVLYLAINRFVLKRRPTALIQPDAPVTLLLAAGVPVIGVACALWTAIWPGHDFSIAVILVGVLFGMTVEAVLPARA